MISPADKADDDINKSKILHVSTIYPFMKPFY